MSDHYDLVVIGSGPAGQQAALRAAELNRRVAIVERGREIGGVAVHTGTIPSKVLREAAACLASSRRHGRVTQGSSEQSMEELLEQVAITINRETEVMAHQLRRSNIEIIQGCGRFLDAHRLQVENRHGKACVLEADHILLATGTRPQRPADVPFDGEVVVDSDDILRLKKLPRSLVVIGAGVIGVEYASIFNTLDTRVVLVDERPQMIDFMDRELIGELKQLMRNRGIEVRLADAPLSIERDPQGQATVIMKSGRQYAAEMVLYAVGRTGCVSSLGLEAAGLSADQQGRISVNAYYQTAVPHIYAAGDVIGFPALASTSMEQGRLAASHAFDQGVRSHPELFPLGVYAVPEMSMVGRTEERLIAENIPYFAGVARYGDTVRGNLMGLREGVLKLLFSREDRRLLGVHILGEEAAELVHVGQAVLALDGGLDYFLEAVFNHPTLAEIYRLAARDALCRLAG